MQLSENLQKSTTLADSVADCILQYVQKEQLSAGDMLPKEEEIATWLNVSRHIVREGISGLKTLGVIESRKRKGMFLRQHFNAFEGVRKLAAARLFSKEQYRQFMQIRVIMEMGMVNYIWKNRTQEEIAELRKLAATDGVPSIQDEIAFHSKLFSMGGNDIASQFQNILISAFDPAFHTVLKNWSSNAVTHIQICDALAGTSIEKFRKLMEKHFQVYLQ
ncbi:MAG: FadR family transcriptional regulator [Lentisphaeria bacterium]|nr:FadR family transcriptional regulator [Lentisphaeria bacterium]